MFQIKRYKNEKFSRFPFTGKKEEGDNYIIKEYLVSTPLGIVFVSASMLIFDDQTKVGTCIIVIHEGVRYQTYIDRFLDTQKKATLAASKFIKEVKSRYALEDPVELARQFEENNNISIKIDLFTDGSGKVKEFWEDDKLHEFHSVQELKFYLKETLYKLDDEGQCISPVKKISS